MDAKWRGRNSVLRSVLLCAPFWAIGSPAGAAPLSPTEQHALLDIAGSHPNAAIALLFLGKEAPAGSTGTLYLEGMPSLQALQLLLDVDGSSSRDSGELVLPRNPYSTTPYYVEVRWAISARSGTSWRISMQAELVSNDGQPLQPPHVLEAPVTIVVGRGTFTMLRAQSDGV